MLSFERRYKWDYKLSYVVRSLHKEALENDALLYSLHELHQDDLMSLTSTW